MLSIEQHISFLLFDHECVIVPGLGAFVTNTVDAAVDIRLGLISPARKEVVFNNLLSHNDGLLANRIATHERIGFAEANSKIQEFVDSLTSRLRKGETVTLPQIGSMTSNRDNVIVFMADPQSNYNPDSFGLQTISIRLLPQQSKVQCEELKRDEVWRSVSIHRQLSGWAATIVALLCFGQYLGDSSLRTLSSEQASIISLPTTESSSPVNPSDEDISYSIADEMPEADSNISQPVFHIIVGSYTTDRDADKKIAELEKQGITGLSKVRTSKSKRIRISVASFPTREEATTHNKSIRRIKGMEKAWILQN